MQIALYVVVAIVAYLFLKKDGGGGGGGASSPQYAPDPLGSNGFAPGAGGDGGGNRYDFDARTPGGQAAFDSLMKIPLSGPPPATKPSGPLVAPPPARPPGPPPGSIGGSATANRCTNNASIAAKQNLPLCAGAPPAQPKLVAPPPAPVTRSSIIARPSSSFDRASGASKRIDMLFQPPVATAPSGPLQQFSRGAGSGRLRLV